MHYRLRATHILTLAIAAVCGSAQAASLTIFHNNDGESKLFGDANFGGAAHFLTTLDGLRTANVGRDQLTISSGDNFLAGIAFNAGFFAQPTPIYYDALALSAIGYDAITIGNHDFDFGPGVLTEFIDFYNANGGTAPFLSANLDFTGEPGLQALKDSGRIANSTIIDRGPERYGIIGVTTETLPTVSSPGNVVANPVLTAIQAEVTALEAAGVNKIILSSHLQGITNELNLVPQLRGIDVVIAGGGDELLINADNARNTLDQAGGPYPLTVQDADGRNVAIVTTVGEYLYVGNLQVEFDTDGHVVNVGGEPVVVDKSTTIADPNMQATVIAPLNTALAAANAIEIATTDVFLEHSDGDTNGPRAIRQRETNLGNLIADAFVWTAQSDGSGLNAGNILLGLTNSGGIREDLDNDADGTITQGEAIGTLPFANTLAVIGDVDVGTLIAALENAVSRIQADGTGTDGRFAQISGFAFDYDRNRPAGDRVVAVRLADGTPVWNRTEGALLVELFDIVTNSFLAGAGTPDGYDFGTTPRTLLSTGYADSLIAFLSSPLGLNGIVLAADYPLGGAGRINAVPLPAALWLFGAGVVSLAGLSRRRRAG